MFNDASVKSLLTLIAITCAWGSEIDPVLNLDECVRIALEQSPYLERSMGERLQRSASVFSALSAVIPTLSFTTSYDRSGPDQTPGTDSLGFPPGFSPVYSNEQYQTAININAVLIDLASFAGLKAAFTVADIAETTFRGSKADLAYNVKEAYYNLIAVHKNIDVTQASAAQSEEQMLIARERFALGAIARPELLRIEVDRARRRIELINARSELETANRNLANQIGRLYPLAVDTSLQFPQISGPPPDHDSLVTIILKKNPSMISANFTLEVQKTNRLSTQLQKVPVIGAGFSYGSASTEPGWGNWSDNDSWNLGVQLTWNIFEGLGWYGRLRESNAQVQTAEAEQKITRGNLLQEINGAYNEYLSSREALSTAEILREQAREQLRVTQEQFRLGATSALELIQSQTAYQQAILESIQIIISYHLSYARIIRLAGEW
ncbi:MAG: TolC family protein [Fibrobacter sp.]|nr:TolC family protein [Fibrobacter sp.]